MIQLFQALHCLHRIGMAHCNVQPKTLLIVSEDPFHIELTGFELSAFNEEPNWAPGSPPEIWEKKYRGSVGGTIWEDNLARAGCQEEWPRSPCGKAVDIWSAGVVCSEITLQKSPCYLERGQPPKRSDADEEAVEYIKVVIAVREQPEIWAQRLGLPLKSTCSVLLRFLQKLLDLDSRTRAAAEDCLKDPWLTLQEHDSQTNSQTFFTAERCCKEASET